MSIVGTRPPTLDEWNKYELHHRATRRSEGYPLAVEKLNLTDDLLVMAGDNVLDFSLSKFVEFAKEKNTSCVMCHEENELKKQQKTAIITLDNNDLITSYEEKPKEPKGKGRRFYRRKCCYW